MNLDKIINICLTARYPCSLNPYFACTNQSLDQSLVPVSCRQDTKYNLTNHRLKGD